jgi:S-(hydroxymethyl)glutathione dehydrogenase/alcohol dehydrogenase
MMMVKAAVLERQGEPLVVRDIELPGPGPGQVRVRVAAAGVCHSDLSLANATLPQPVPAVLGHEGAGVVVAVGEGVDRVGVGDHVLLNWSPSCGDCWFCQEGEPYLCEHGADASRAPYATLPDGTPVYLGLGTGAFAEQTVVSQRAVIPLPRDLPLEQAAVLGCAVLTGAGAVFNTAGVRPEQSVVVFGLGGVGLSALRAARIAGADPVIGVDVSPGKEKPARTHGASEFLVSGERTSKEIRTLTGGRGADHAFDCVGLPATIRAAWSSTRRGGSVTVVGIGGKDERVSFSALELYWFGRTLSGCVFGSSDPDRDVPRLLNLVAEGRLDLASLASSTIDLTGINDAFDRMSNGQGVRSIVRFPMTDQ